MFRHANPRISAIKFQNDMKHLWQDNSEVTIQFISNAIVNSESTSHWSERLYQNQQKIVNGITKFCGDRKKISELFAQFIQFIGHAIDVFVWKKNTHQLREQWHNKADELINILHSLNEWQLRNYFYNKISIIEAIIKSLIKKNSESVAHYRKELISNNTNLSTALTNAIIADNRTVFI